MRIQDTSGAGHSPKERSGVDCKHPEINRKPVFSITDTGYSLGEVYGGARVWQESCAWGRDKINFRVVEVHGIGTGIGHVSSYIGKI